MLSVRELAASLYGAYRLARFDASGLRFFDTSPAGAGRSFYAAAIVAPFYGLMLTVASPQGDINYLRFGFIEGTAYVLSWVAYPVIIEWLTRLLGCRERFEGYLAAYNWSMVLQNVAIFPVAMLVGLGMITLEVGQLLWFGVFLAILFYIGFIARIALEISLFTAAGLVVLDVLLSALIDGVAAGLY
jgi:hypothetical protein